MGNFKDRGGRSGGFRGGDRGGDRGGRSNNFGGGRGGDRRGSISMHKAICDKCHKSCEVPFKPSNDKPIYCNDCFEGKRGSDAPRRDFNKRDSNRDFGNKQNFSRAQNDSFVSDDIKKQLSDINAKLDKLASLLEKAESPKVASVVVSSPKSVAKKVEKKTVIKVAEKKETKEKKPVAKKVSVEKKSKEKKVVSKKKK